MTKNNCDTGKLAPLFAPLVSEKCRCVNIIYENKYKLNSSSSSGVLSTNIIVDCHSLNIININYPENVIQISHELKILYFSSFGSLINYSSIYDYSLMVRIRLNGTYISKLISFLVIYANINLHKILPYPCEILVNF